MLKKLLNDWTLWLLVLFNIYLLYYYLQNSGEFRTLVFLYWTQSVVIGLATGIDIATIYKIKPGSMEANGKPLENTAAAKGRMAIAFLVHYGIFHMVYLIFIIVDTPGSIDYHFLKIGMGIICLNVAIDFVHKKIQQRHIETDVGKTFVTPYVRIVPMHIMLMLPGFFGTKKVTIFIVLKIVMDILMHIATSGYYKKQLPPVSSGIE